VRRLSAPSEFEIDQCESEFRLSRVDEFAASCIPVAVIHSIHTRDALENGHAESIGSSADIARFLCRYRCRKHHTARRQRRIHAHAANHDGGVAGQLACCARVLSDYGARLLAITSLLTCKNN
jgi:hypothetical protein